MFVRVCVYVHVCVVLVVLCWLCCASCAVLVVLCVRAREYVHMRERACMCVRMCARAYVCMYV